MATFYIDYLWSLTLENTIPSPRTWEMETGETRSPRLHRKSGPITLHLTEKVFPVIHLSTQWTKMHTSVCWQYINSFKSKPIILSINKSSATTFFFHMQVDFHFCFLKCRLLKLHIHNEFGEMWKENYIFWLFCDFSQGFCRKKREASVCDYDFKCRSCECSFKEEPWNVARGCTTQWTQSKEGKRKPLFFRVNTSPSPALVNLEVS